MLAALLLTGACCWYATPASITIEAATARPPIPAVAWHRLTQCCGEDVVTFKWSRSWRTAFAHCSAGRVEYPSAVCPAVASGEAIIAPFELRYLADMCEPYCCCDGGRHPSVDRCGVAQLRYEYGRYSATCAGGIELVWPVPSPEGGRYSPPEEGTP